MCDFGFYICCNLCLVPGTYFIRLDEDQPTQETIATLRATPGTNIIYGAISSGANNMWDFFMVSKDVPSIDVIMNRKPPPLSGNNLHCKLLVSVQKKQLQKWNLVVNVVIVTFTLPYRLLYGIIYSIMM